MSEMRGAVTIAQLIKLADDLKAAYPSLAAMKTYEAPPSVIPPGCPLYTNTTNAAKIFSIGEHTLRKLVRRNADFPCVRIGVDKILIDVPGLYEWLHSRNGGRVPCNDEDE